ncbi:MAG: glycerophosphodiester phosphodiesterase family protein [Candidatus Hydrogenedentes bacterium]|nr:glycerophosphodiester phosphodiesterase family protein [Candidatus Hydrogenedentota bacterium]
MVKAMRRLSIVAAFAIAALNGWTLPPITPEEAVQLVSYKMDSLQNSKVERVADKTPVTYHVTCKAKGEQFEAVVDGQVARVLSITSGNGQAIYTWPGILAVGHRGTVTFAPENTIPAFNKAIELGADLLEMDVRETKDGHLVIMHDGTVKRTTGEKGAISQMTLGEIRKLDAGALFGPEFKGTRVPTFEEAMEAIKGRALPDIDFKMGTPRKVVEAVREAGLLGKVTLYCGNLETMKQTVAIDPGFLTRPTVPTEEKALKAFLKEINPSIVNMGWDDTSLSVVRTAHLAGKLAFVNAMGKEDNETLYVKAIEGGADYIQTDRLDLLLPALRKHGVHK